MSLLMLLSALLASAEEAMKAEEIKRIPAHNPEWTNSRESDPGTTDSVVPELQGIVVLCATEPQSAEFKKQWAAYVRHNYEPAMNIDAVIKDVLLRADAYRAKQRSGSKKFPKSTVQSNATTERVMHETAKAAIQNVR